MTLTVNCPRCDVVIEAGTRTASSPRCRRMSAPTTTSSTRFRPSTSSRAFDARGPTTAERYASGAGGEAGVTVEAPVAIQ